MLSLISHRLALNSESELDRLLGGLSNDTARSLAVEVAIARDAARYVSRSRHTLTNRVPAKVKARFGQLAEEMTNVQTQSTAADTLLTIRKLRQWCDGTGALICEDRTDDSHQSTSPGYRLSKIRFSGIGTA